MNRIAVYGSLRKGDYNNAIIRDAELVGQVRLEGWKLYDLGIGYPAVARGEGNVLFDIFDVTDEQATRIHNMELGAHYTPLTVDTGQYGEAMMYFFDEKTLKRYLDSVFDPAEEVTSGDWIEHKHGNVREGATA